MLKIKNIRVLAILFICLTLFIGCDNSNKTNEKELDSAVYFCDAETLSKDDVNFITNGKEFGGGAGRTSEEAYEGEFSCAVNKDYLYGLTYIFKDIKPGEVFDVSVYRKTTGHKGILVAQSIEGGIYKYEQFSFKKKDENGWDILSLNIQLPENVDTLKGLKFYVYNGDEKGDKVYFDNLKIHRYKRVAIQDSIKKGVFNIELTDYDLKTLKGYREKALAQNIISKDLKKEVDGILKYNGKTVKISIRLKGDWTDHLEGDKWSYRIKVRDGQSIMGVRSFSIQNPTVRDYLHEWVIHKICEKEDLLTTKFDYVPVVINGIDFGLYNFEEHFEKQLVESKNRREGVILKFSEDGFWEANLFYEQTKKITQKPFYEASIITPFKKKKTFRTPKLESQFLVAQNLMLKYKNGDEDIENYLDVDRLAKAYALMDLGNIEHAYAWHNQRFYYNPVISKLELITYDCYSKPGESMRRDFGIKGDFDSGEHITYSHEYCLKNVFDNPSFQELYLKYLKKYSSEEYLATVFNELDPLIDSLTESIRNEHDFYFYDKNFLKENAEKIRQLLPKYEQKVGANKIKFTLKKDVNNLCVPQTAFKYISLNAHLQEERINGSVLLSLKNYHCKPITIIGYSSELAPDSLITISNKIRLNNFPVEEKASELIIKEKPKKLFYKVDWVEDDSTYTSKIVGWKRPNKTVAQENTMKGNLSLETDIYVLKDNVLTFNKGTHHLDENIIIPKGLKVLFEPGVNLILNKSTFIMSYSPVTMVGNKLDSIKISSTDGTGRGFTVLQAKEKSELEYVVFNGLNTYSNNGWTLTGAVTFYESNVDISNSTFKNNNCEDALNTIRSEFTFRNSTISNSFSDGFDADFCKGIIVNSNFNNLGNDCLDFSGSVITIYKCIIDSVADKGISCGEKSTVNVIETSIYRANTGIASKDASNVLVKNVNIKNCQIGLSVFEKKSEYGPALIFLEEHNIKSTPKPQIIEKGSQIKWDKIKIL
jgi:CotH kinase protein/Right handed beta helix region